MLKGTIVRIAGALATIAGASLLAFLLMRVVPGDPVRLIVGETASDEAVRAQTAAMGLNEPLPIQYLRYVGDFLTGDWGFAYGVGQPVGDVFATRLPATLELGFCATLIALVAAVGLVVLATSRRRRWADLVIRAASSVGMGAPPFWVGLILLLLFTQELGVLPGPEGRLSPGAAAPPPVTGFFTVDALLAGQVFTFLDALAHLLLPAITMALAPFAFLVRLLRSNVLEVSREPFVVVARSKGLSQGQTFARHVLPNGMLPTLTASGLIFAEMLAGSVLAEKIFNWPGLGALVVDSVLRQDFAVVQTFIFVSAVTYVLINLVVDLLYGVVDPRVRIPAVIAR